MGVEGTNHIYDRIRRTELEGRINIYMAPAGNKTTARVNAAYVFEVTATRRGITFPDRDSETSTLSFTSTQPSGRDDVVCRSKGVLEQRILDIIKGSG
jgi:hypothetical protein